MKKILVLDNYDSFTYNLVQYIEEIVGHEVDVFRNNKITLDSVAAYDKILLSPGPGVPSQAGIMLELIKRYAPEKSILGVCLGHQAIAQAFGGQLVNYATVYHGVAARINIINPAAPLFANLGNHFNVGRYHAWGVLADKLPECLEITATDEEGNIMAIQHKTYDVQGVQFHPESVLTDFGMEIMERWINH